MVRSLREVPYPHPRRPIRAQAAEARDALRAGDRAATKELRCQAPGFAPGFPDVVSLPLDQCWGNQSREREAEQGSEARLRFLEAKAYRELLGESADQGHFETFLPIHWKVRSEIPERENRSFFLAAERDLNLPTLPGVIPVPGGIPQELAEHHAEGNDRIGPRGRSSQSSATSSLIPGEAPRLLEGCL
jgi:hypothetical protein